MTTVFRFRPEDFPFWSRRFPGGALAAFVFAAGVVEAVGFLLVGYDIGGGEALMHHAHVKAVVEILMADERIGQVVQLDEGKGPDEQPEHAELGRTLAAGEHLAEKIEIGARHAAGLTVDDVLDAVARGLEKGKRIVAIHIKDHAQEAGHEAVVLNTAVAVAVLAFGGAGEKIAFGHIRVFKQALEHFLTDISVESFVHSSGYYGYVFKIICKINSFFDVVKDYSLII